MNCTLGSALHKKGGCKDVIVATGWCMSFVVRRGGGACFDWTSPTGLVINLMASAAFVLFFVLFGKVVAGIRRWWHTEGGPTLVETVLARSNLILFYVVLSLGLGAFALGEALR